MNRILFGIVVHLLVLSPIHGEKASYSTISCTSTEGIQQNQPSCSDILRPSSLPSDVSISPTFGAMEVRGGFSSRESSNSSRVSEPSEHPVAHVRGASVSPNNVDGIPPHAFNHPVDTMSDDARERAAVQKAIQDLILMWGINFIRAAIKNRNEFKVSGGGRSEIMFDDVVGCDEAKHELKQVLEFIKHPEKFEKLGAKIPRGVLLVGPPGTGKTLMARAMAGEAGVPFISTSGSDFSSEWAGVGTTMVKRLFAKARRFGRCIVFIDEVDTIGRKRSGKDSALAIDSESTLNQLLVEMDGFDDKGSGRRGLFGFGRKKSGSSGILVLAGTNRPSMLDSALTRAGRFDRVVNVDPPDIAGRRALFNKYMERLPLAEPPQPQTSTSTDIVPNGGGGGGGATAAASRSLSSSSKAARSFLQLFVGPANLREDDINDDQKDKEEHTESKSLDLAASPSECGACVNATAATSGVGLLDDPEGEGATSAVGRDEENFAEAAVATERREKFAQILAEMTPGFTGAQVANLCNEAALRAATADAQDINITHFSDAFDRIVGGLERSKAISPADLRRTAVHEAGHALVAWMLPHAEPPLKVSVVWRGDTLGFTQTKSFERTGKTQAVLMDEIAVLLAGRAAEELVFGDASTGASHDLQRVTTLAYYLIGQVGYSSKIGQLALRHDLTGQHVGVSETTAALMDREARILVNRAHSTTKRLLRKHSDKLIRLADELVKHEVLLEEKIEQIFGPRPALARAIASEYEQPLSPSKTKVTASIHASMYDKAMLKSLRMRDNSFNLQRAFSNFVVTLRSWF